MSTTTATQGNLPVRVSMSAPGPQGAIAQQSEYKPGDTICIDGNATLSIDNTYAAGKGGLTWVASLNSGGKAEELKETPSSRMMGGGSRAMVAASTFSLPYSALGASNNVLTLMAVAAGSKDPVFTEQFPVEKTYGKVLAPQA